MPVKWDVLPEEAFETASEKRYCDIVIPVWNQLERTERCLESILKNTKLPRFGLILVDNASGKRTAEYLRNFHKGTTISVTLIRNEENLGNIKAVNQGMHISEADYVCVLDNDTMVFPNWLERMIEAAESRKEIGIVNPGSNDLGYQKPWYFSWDYFAQKIGEEERGNWREIATASGFCMLVKRALIDTIGGWSEDYGIGYYEDHDYSRRAHQAGFICLHARDAFVYHEVSGSFRLLKKEKARITASNQLLFEERHGKAERIAFCLDQVNPQTKRLVIDESIKLARDNNWVTVLLHSKADLVDYDNHGFIKLIYFWRPVFLFLSFFHILLKKKKFNRIFLVNGKLLKVLSAFKFVHRAELEKLDTFCAADSAVSEATDLG